MGVLAAIIAALSLPAGVSAHHAFSAEFDANQPITLRGTLTKFEWVNPHSWLHLDVKGPDGKVVSWAIEGGAPNALIRRGMNKNSVPTGVEILVEAYLAKDGSKRANGVDVTFLADGRKMFMGSSGTGAPYDKKP
jgi:uncharacterized protein DUF6152